MPSASRIVIFISKPDPENSAEYLEYLHLYGNRCAPVPSVPDLLVPLLVLQAPLILFILLLVEHAPPAHVLLHLLHATNPLLEVAPCDLSYACAHFTRKKREAKATEQALQGLRQTLKQGKKLTLMRVHPVHLMQDFNLLLLAVMQG